jgi:hypothetical protein
MLKRYQSPNQIVLDGIQRGNYSTNHITEIIEITEVIAGCLNQPPQSSKDAAPNAK